VPLGIAWPDGKERFARLKEAVTLIRQLWTEDRVTFEGTYYRTDKATIYDKPDQPVPLYIGASGPAATRLAGRVATASSPPAQGQRPLHRDAAAGTPRGAERPTASSTSST